MNLIKIRRRQKRKKPKFLRDNAKNKKRLGDKWRASKGRQNKRRQHKKSRGAMPHPGYGSPKAVRGFHPSGFPEILVRNMKELENVEKSFRVRLASVLGKKKKIAMIKKAKELGLTILNPIREEKK